MPNAGEGSRPDSILRSVSGEMPASQGHLGEVAIAACGAKAAAETAARFDLRGAERETDHVTDGMSSRTGWPS